MQCAPESYRRRGRRSANRPDEGEGPSTLEAYWYMRATRVWSASPTASRDRTHSRMEEHEGESRPSALRRRLSNAPDFQVGAVTIPAAKTPHRRASHMSTAMAITTLDDKMNMRPILVLGMLYFQEPLDLDELRRLLVERLLELPRFSAVAVDHHSHIEFHPVPKMNLDMKYHVTEVTQSGPWSWACGLL